MCVFREKTVSSRVVERTTCPEMCKRESKRECEMPTTQSYSCVSPCVWPRRDLDKYIGVRKKNKCNGWLTTQISSRPNELSSITDNNENMYGYMRAGHSPTAGIDKPTKNTHTRRE